jgi:hypothetical protein
MGRIGIIPGHRPSAIKGAMSQSPKECVGPTVNSTVLIQRTR